MATSILTMRRQLRLSFHIACCIQISSQIATLASSAICTTETGDSCTAPTPTRSLRFSRVVKAGVAFPTGDPSFKVFQPFPKELTAEAVDPFLMCDEWGASKKSLGVPAIDPGAPEVVSERHVGWHPHRGFDILTYVKEGRGRHADSLGNFEIVRPGGIQWMRTGSGVEHAEGGGTPKDANKHGFQIWINLPSRMKMADPEYGTVQPEDIPQVTSDSGVSRLLAGFGGASFKQRADIHIADCEVASNSVHTHPIPVSVESLVIYVYRGDGSIAGQSLSPQEAAVFQVENQEPGVEETLKLQLRAGNDGLGVLIFAGRPIREPIAWNGPIVMNTQSELRTAYDELNTGRFYKKRVAYDYKVAADKAY